jgi:hypothetical protein
VKERANETSEGLESPKFSRVKGRREGKGKMKGRKEGSKKLRKKRKYIKKGMK